MAKKYIIRPGASFRLPDGTVKSAGDEIDLDSDVVLAHPNSVDPVPDPDPAPAFDAAQNLSQL